jgi:protein-L-isoaspartate(D-aspartate) O-methyltransferase
MPNFTVARTNMVESQLRTGGMINRHILAAFAAVPREAFVPADRRSIAYMDDDLLIRPAEGARAPRYLMEPTVLAKLIDLAEIGPEERVLHVGCGTGYATAILSALARKVIAIDEDAELVAVAGEALALLNIANVDVRIGSHADGAPTDSPFDAVLIEGQIPAVPADLLAQLNENGRLVAVVGQTPGSRAMLFTRHGKTFGSRPAFEASVMPLPGFAVDKPAFVF